MNLGTLLSTAGDIADLSPNQSPAALDRQRRFANSAIDELLARGPTLFDCDERRFGVPASLSPLSGETLLVDGDAWLLKLDSLDAAAIAQWRLDGTHATQAIHITRTDGSSYRRVIQGVANIGGEIYITITEPWINTTDTGLRWSVLTEDFYLPKDLRDITGVRLSDAANTWYREIHLISSIEGRRDLTGVHNRIASGNPWRAHPGGDLHLPTPRAATAVTAPDATAFSAYPADKFNYYVTLAWGSRPEGGQRPPTPASASARLRPLIQSEPSSAVSATPVAGVSHVVLSLPDIRTQLAMTTGTRSNPDLVGYYLCVYRAAVGEQPKLLFTVPAGTTTIVDDGTTFPDFFAPMPRTGGCRSLTFDQIPADQLIVDGVWAPPTLFSDSEGIKISNLGAKVLVEMTAELIHRKLSNDGPAAAARARAESLLLTVSNEDGTGQDPSRPRRKRTRRIRGAYWHPGPRHIVDYDWGS